MEGTTSGDATKNIFFASTSTVLFIVVQKYLSCQRDHGICALLFFNYTPGWLYLWYIY